MKKIILYGNSILIAGISSSLNKIGGLDVAVCSDLEELKELHGHAKVVMVDMDDPRAAQVLALFQSRLDLVVIGVDSPAGAVTVISGQAHHVSSIDDIVKWLQASGP